VHKNVSDRILVLKPGSNEKEEKKVRTAGVFEIINCKEV